MILKQLAKKIILASLTITGFMLFTTANYADKTCNWSGAWNTNNGPLEINQNANKIKGTFTEKNFNIKGTVNGRFFIGEWVHTQANKPESGHLNLLISEDCSSFIGDRSNDLDSQSTSWEFNSIKGDRASNKKSPESNKDVPNGFAKKVFNIKNIPISFLMDNNWTYEIDKDKNILFTSKKYPDTIVIYIINEVFDYNNDDEKNMFLESQKEEAAKASSGDIKTETKTISGKNVDLIKVPQDGVKTVIFLPDTGKSYFMMTATYSNAEEMVTAESLLYSIMEGMLNSK